MPRAWQHENLPLAACAWAFPLAGLLCGAVGALVLVAASWLGVHPLMAALLAITTMVMLTGALHEDGLADCADGFFGHHERARKLEIMKDSRIGTYGVLALGLVTALKVTALAQFARPQDAAYALLAAETISRALLPLMMFLLPLAREEGLAGAAGKPGRVQVLVALKIAFVIGFLLLQEKFWLAGVAAILAYVLARLLAVKHLGGYTGDVLGMLQQLSAAFMLIALSR